MNFRAFLRNSTKPFIRGTWNRLKFLYWLYYKGKPFPGPDTVNLHLRFAPPLGDIDLTVRSRSSSDAFIFSEVFEHRYYDFDLPAPPPTILDAGANAGFTALYLARKYPQAALACVEPMPDNVRLLRLNIEQNHVNVQVVAKALSIADGPIAMQIAAEDYGHKIADIEFGRPLEGATLNVPGVSVPTLLAELGWERIGLLKIDIEGYEGVLLRENCQWLERVDALCIECHEGFGEKDLQEVASKFGFAAPRRLPGTTLLVRDGLNDNA